MPVRRSVALLAAAGAIVVASVGGSVALAQQGDAPTGSSDDALVARLDALDLSLPAEPAPTAVHLDESGDEGTEPWGTLDGDVAGQAAMLATIEAELRSLYIDADAATGLVSDAVADIARGWLDLAHAYRNLTVWDGHDLAFPTRAQDDEGTSTGADELRGRAETGLRLVIGAQQRLLVGYATLRDLAEAEPAAQVRLDQRASAAEVYDREVLPDVRRLLSQAGSQILVPIDRFDTRAPGAEARARTLVVTCVDRSVYDEQLAAGADAPPRRSDVRHDCPSLPEELRVEQRLEHP